MSTACQFVRTVRHIPTRTPRLAVVQSLVSTGQPHSGVARAPAAILQGGTDSVPLGMILGLNNRVDIMEYIPATVEDTFKLCANTVLHYDRTLTLGGDHSVAVGTVGAQLLEHGENLGVLWVDAHSDINTRRTSTTGNTHGMPLSRLLGLERDPWMRDSFPTLDPSQIVYLGLNSVDPAEQAMIDSLGITCVHASEVKTSGVDGAFDLITPLLDHFDCLHVSFDVDVCGDIAGTGTPEGILSTEETLDVAREIKNRFEEVICGVDLVETNVHDFPCPKTIPLARNILTNILC
jgi:arginase